MSAETLVQTLDVMFLGCEFPFRSIQMHPDASPMALSLRNHRHGSMLSEDALGHIFT